MAGAAIALLFYATGVWVLDHTSFGAGYGLWIAARQMFDASVFVALSRYYEVSFGAYGPGRLALLASVNAAVYLAVGASLVAARRISRWFYVLTLAIVTPFALMGGYLLVTMVLI